MARRALWRSGAAEAAPRLAHLDQDRPLVEAAKREPARFDALYRRYLARVYSYAYYELGDHHAAEDATEATFVSALANLQRFEERARPADGEGASTFRVWLFQIARNEVAGERRRARRRPVEPIGETLGAMVADPLNVEAEAVRRDEARAAWRAVGRLPRERRQAMVLRFVDELSTAEIAGVLGKSEGTVRVLIHRALRSVAKDLGTAKDSGKTSEPDA
jgi:RNA polymerase sigma-70 factor (ECF subfamily)